MIFCCLKAVNLFKRLCQIVMYVLWDFTYILWNLVLDLPSVVWNRDAFLCFLPSHDINDLKVSKLCRLLKATHWTFSRKRSQKSKDIQKKILELAFIHFSFFLTINAKLISPWVLNLLCKSVDWFLYDRDLRHDRVKEKQFFL